MLLVDGCRIIGVKNEPGQNQYTDIWKVIKNYSWRNTNSMKYIKIMTVNKVYYAIKNE